MRRIPRCVALTVSLTFSFVGAYVASAQTPPQASSETPSRTTVRHLQADDRPIVLMVCASVSP
jgi:hypothetical protein